MMEDIMKGFGVEAPLAEKASAFLNSVFGYLMEDNMAVVQQLVETFGGEDMNGELKDSIKRILFSTLYRRVFQEMTIFVQKILHYGLSRVKNR